MWFFLFTNDILRKNKPRRSSRMKIVIVEPNKDPYVAMINNKLEEFQAIVDGWIETVSFTGELLIICNEEGKIRNLPVNRELGWDKICGTFFVIGNDAPEFRSLTDEECTLAMNFFKL
jgi:hypothetical protein